MTDGKPLIALCMTVKGLEDVWRRFAQMPATVVAA